MLHRSKPYCMNTLRAQKNDRKLVDWNEETLAAFENCKKELADTVLLAHPVDTAPITLVTDASDVAIGATLEQFHEER